MTASLSRFSRKALLLLGVLALMSLIGPAEPVRPVHACGFQYCLWDPPMHWNYALCACVCDCPRDPLGDPTDISNCGPCW